MGNSQPNVILPVLGNPKQPDPWKVTENIAYCDLVTNVETGQQAQSYTVPLDGRIKLQQEFEKYEYRRTQNENLVKVYRVYKRNSQYLCSGMDFLNVKTERIPWRLNEIRQLTLPEAVYTLGCALVGYKRIRELIGHVKIDGNMIGITPNGQVRVWLNENLAKNHPEMEYEFDPQIPEAEAQKQMIQYIVHTIKLQTQGQQFPPEIAQRLTPDRLRTFDSAIQLIRQITQSLGLNLGQTRIDVRSAAPAQMNESKISNRQSLPPMPSTVQMSSVQNQIPQSQIPQQSQINPVQISQVLQPGVSQLIQGQSQIIPPNSQLLQSQILNQSQIDQLNSNTIQLVRKSSSNSNLRNSGVFVDPVQRESTPMQIIVTRASEIYPTNDSPNGMQIITPVVYEQAQLPVQIPQNSQVSYQQTSTTTTTTNLPPLQQGRPTSAKGRPPIPGYSKPPEVVPYQVVQAVNELRRSASRQLRRSLSRQSHETAQFGHVSRQPQLPVQVQHHKIEKKVQIQSQPPPQNIGIRAQSPARNQSNSRVLVGPRIVGPPITQLPIRTQTQSQTQIFEQFPKVTQYAPQQVVADRPPPPRVIQQHTQKVTVTERQGDRIQYLPVQYQKPQMVERSPLFNQLGNQDRVVVKRSIEKINQNISNNNSMTVINTQTNSGSGVVHLLRHHNRMEQSSYEQVARPNVPKPTTAGDMSRGIGFFNDKGNQYKY